MTNKLTAITLFTIIIYAVSCSIESVQPKRHCIIPKSYDYILVPKENALLYAEIPGLNERSRTKSLGQELISLESLIDRTLITEEDFKGYHIVQIPFKEQANTSCAILTDSLKQSYSTRDTTIIKKFLVLISDNNSGERISIVTTFIPTPSYIELYGHDSFNYMDKSTFEGIVLNSELDGSFRSVYIYGEHPIWAGHMCNTDSNLKKEEQKFYLSIANCRKTKGGDIVIDGGEIAGSICIATKSDSRNSLINEDIENDPIFQGHHESGGGGGGGGGEGHGNSPGADKPRINTDNDCREVFDSITSPAIIEDKRVIKDDVKTFKIRLWSYGPGSVLGAGEYPAFKIVTCTALANAIFADFDRWTGDFSGLGATVNHIVKKDIESTAYFFNFLTDTTSKRPCYNRETGIFNPLKTMAIASPGASGLRGGTFGKVRTNNTRNHSGIDLLANIGTEIYAMIDGVIDKKYVVEQPDLDENGDGKLPTDYTGDDNPAGNRIYLKGTYNSTTIRIGYWHLQAGTPVAINPRTKRPFAPGDKVYKGELLAFTGKTGNAYNVANKHLHLTYEINGVKHNPEELINGKVDWNERMTKVLTAGLKFIKCDSETNGVELL